LNAIVLQNIKVMGDYIPTIITSMAQSPQVSMNYAYIPADHNGINVEIGFAYCADADECVRNFKAAKHHASDTARYDT
jgi:hypothetical protein